MKRTLKVIIIAFVFLGLSSAVYSIGIGASFGVNSLGDNPGTSTMLSLKLDQMPFLLGIGANSGGGGFVVGATADWWFVNANLVNFINYYAGPGIYAAVGSNTLDFGGRLPLGLNAFPLDFLELFIEIAPTLGVGLDPFVFPKFGLQSALGLRFWF